MSTVTEQEVAAAEQRRDELRAAADAAKATYWPDLEAQALDAEDWAASLRHEKEREGA